MNLKKDLQKKLKTIEIESARKTQKISSSSCKNSNGKENRISDFLEVR